jgi:hypothetical protein
MKTSCNARLTADFLKIAQCWNYTNDDDVCRGRETTTEVGTMTKIVSAIVLAVTMTAMPALAKNALQSHRAPDAAASTASHPNVRDDGQRPFLGDRMAGVLKAICPTAKVKICPSGYFAAAMVPSRRGP